MARPSTTDDLDKWDKKGHDIVVVDLNLLSKIPGALAAYAALTDIIRSGDDLRAPIAKPDPDRTGTWVVELSGAELREKIAERQRSWDRGKADYEAFIDDGKFPQYQTAMVTYCRAEGIEPPKKPKTEDVEVAER